VEVRPSTAARAAGKLTCFGGKRESGESGVECVLRELREELGGWQPAYTPRRAVDLHVDGHLVAWFFEAEGPSAKTPLNFEVGRDGLWLPLQDLLNDSRLSPWHAAVLRAHSEGARVANFVSPDRRDEHASEQAHDRTAD